MSISGDLAFDDESRPADRAYEGIKRRILGGTLRPGHHLGEEQLAIMTGTSRTPVREALRRLAGEGFVVIGANRRSYVAEFDPVEADSVFEIRVRLESYAAKLAARLIKPDGITRLEALSDAIEALDANVSHGSLIRFFELNTSFHHVIVEASGSRQLAIALAPAIAIPLPLLKHYVWEVPVNIARSNLQHREIIEALKQGNGRWAGDCMAAHINSTRPLRQARPTSSA